MEGRCIAYYSYRDIQKLEKFMQGKPVAEQEISRQLLSEVTAYAESSQCRRKLLLNYFGEEYHQANCQCCDNCIHPKETFDGKAEMSLVIRLIESLPEHFKIDHLANVLAGVSNSIIKSYKHDQLEFFGAGKNHSEKFWCTVIHQGLIARLLDKEIESYGLIYVTDEGRKFLENPWPLTLVEDRTFSTGVPEEDEDEEGNAAAAALRAGGGAGDPALLSMLKDLRKDLSKRLKLQPWIIFGDPSLEDMATAYPISFDELKNCQGVGEGKAKKFGEEFIKLIRKYVEENDIIRPDDFILKSPPNKSANKVFIIQSIDRRMSLEDIAEAKGLEMEELLGEIEAIVSSGMKLNLDYYIEENLDEDIVEEIYDYFRNEATSDDVQQAIEALGPDYYENEIRLVRLKFLCENAI